MKKILTSLFLLTLVLQLCAQNIGINIENPEKDLDVRSIDDDLPATLRLANPLNSRFLELFSGSSIYPDPVILFPQNQSLLFASNLNSFTEGLRILPTGKIGIQVTNPEANLDLKGGNWNLDGGNPGDLRIGANGNYFRIGISTGGNGAGLTRMYSSSHLVLGSTDVARVWIDNQGETGFGTSNPDQKVHINGKLKIGNDTKAPSEGTIRYNSVNKKFEGYDGTKWIDLGTSQPYGIGPFSIPMSIDQHTITGDLRNFIAAQGVYAIRSTSDWIDPFTGFIFKKCYVKLYQQNADLTWTNTIAIEKIQPYIDPAFGRGMAISEDRFLVGNPREKKVEAYKYVASTDTWYIDNIFTSPDTGLEDQFGAAIDLYGGKTIIGAPAATLGPVGPGKAYVYNSSDNLEGTLSGTGATIGDRFGTSVGLTFDRAIVGAPTKEVAGIQKAGSVTIFNRFAGNWSTNSTFTDDTLEENEYYGNQVAIVDTNYFYISENLGADAYLIENGYWVLKETIVNTIPDQSIRGLKFHTSMNMTQIQIPDDDNAINYIQLQKRDENNIFQPISAFVMGEAEVSVAQLFDNYMYAISAEGHIATFLLN